MNLEAQTAISPHLLSNEKILWTGRPPRGLMFRTVDWFFIPFSLLWGGFSFYWEWSVIRSGAKSEFTLFGLIFVFVGFYIIIGRFFVDAWFRSRTYYGVTTERAIIVSGVFSRNVRSVNLRGLTDVSFTEHYGGKGTIAFGPSSFQNSWAKAAPWPGMGQYSVPCFERIDDAKSVMELTRRGQSS